MRLRNHNVNAILSEKEGLAVASNVVHLPRPAELRTPSRRLGLYFRVARDQHKDILDLLAEREAGFHGLVIDAVYSDRHRELRGEALKRGVDVILDPKTQAMATPGGHTETLAKLPWALERPHRPSDFAGPAGIERVRGIAEWTVDGGYTQVLGPTHLLQSANDPWLRHDIEMMGALRIALDGAARDKLLIYPLTISMQMLRDAAQRRAIVSAIGDAPCDAIWLRVENFGSDATGEKTAAYIEACADFRRTGVPIIADHAGGLPGLGLARISHTRHGLRRVQAAAPQGAARKA